jgi:hypothetical protein
VLSISVVSFPLLLDRNVGVAAAVHTSVSAVLVNPLTMALWGLLVAASLVTGFLFAFVARVRVAGPRTCELASLPQGRAVNSFRSRRKRCYRECHHERR